MTLRPAATATTLAFFLSLSAPSTGAEAEAADTRKPASDPPAGLLIHLIGSREELDAIKPDLRFDGWELRLALAPGAMPDIPRKEGDPPDFSAEPWRILYSDWRRVKAGADTPLPKFVDARTGDPIGPLEYELEYEPAGDPIPAVAKIEKLVKLIDLVEIERGTPGHLLFAASIPTPGKGAYRIRIYQPIPDGGGDRKPGDAIAEVTWKQDKESPARWIQFAKPRYVDLPDLEIPVPDEMVVRFLPSAPRFDANYALTHDTTPPADPLPAARQPILGMVPSQADPGFTLSLAGAGIAIRLEDPEVADISHFLARWWIGDKPVAFTFSELPDHLEAEMDMLARLVESPKTFTTRVPFALPFALKTADPDSKVSIQLLYSPAGTMELPNPAHGADALIEMAEMFALRSQIPRLSNRLQFHLRDVLDPATR